MKTLRWYDHFLINIYWLGLNVASGSLTPIILPVLVQQFVPDAQKNTFYGALRAAGLIVAILVQPAAGLLSDRNTSRWGRRRPFITVGTLLDLVFLALIGLSGNYWMLLVALLCLQFSSNIAHGALQGLIPDLVPEDQRGRSSGIKAIMELLPVILVAFTIAKMVDRGQMWLALVSVMGALLVTMLITWLVREEPLREPPEEPLRPLMLRVLGLLAGILIGALAGGAGGVIVGGLGGLLTWLVAGPVTGRLVGVGIAGLVAIVVSIVVGVWASVSIAAEARRYPSFTWWVVNRLLYLAAVGSIQGFALYFLQDVLKIPNPAGATGQLMLVVGVFTLLAALPSGFLADRFGRKFLVAAAGVLAGAGTFLLFLSTTMVMVYVAGICIGVATGVFFTSNWALGTDLVPPQEAGRYLGISNLAGAGAGVVGAGLGGPLADYFNQYSPGSGYMVVFAIYGVCFLLSSVSLRWVQAPAARS